MSKGTYCLGLGGAMQSGAYTGFDTSTVTVTNGSVNQISKYAFIINVTKDDTTLSFSAGSTWVQYTICGGALFKITI